MSDVFVLGEDEVGVVAECDGFRYYLTPCCGASAKGCDGYIGCRACYAEVDPALGGIPDGGFISDGHGGWAYKPTQLVLTVAYGDGLPYDEWKRTMYKNQDT